MLLWSRLLIFLAGLMGAAGVALSAYAAHAEGGANLTTAATFLMIHAAAVAGLCAGAPTRRGLLQAASLLVLGAALFSGDIAMRAISGAPLWRMAAPTGGVMLIVGWLWLALASFAGPRATP